MTKPKKPEERKRRGRPRKSKWPLLGNRFPPVLRTVLDPGPGRPLKWDSNRYARLLVRYAELRIKWQMKRMDALGILAALDHIGFNKETAGFELKKVEERIRQARADAREYGWGAALPEWARPVLSPRFDPTPQLKK